MTNSIPTAIDIFRSIIKELSLYNYQFTFIEHSVSINWRQKYPNYQSRVKHIKESLLQPSPIHQYKFTGEEVISIKFNPRTYVKTQGCVLSVISKIVPPSSGVFHLPMINLHPVDGVTFQYLIKMIKIVAEGMRGYLLETGRYYHFYGIKKLSTEDWLRFNAQFLMPTTLISERYVGHSIYKGYNALRLTTEPHYKPVIPFLCFTFDQSDYQKRFV